MYQAGRNMKDIFLRVSEACKAIFQPTQGSKENKFEDDGGRGEGGVGGRVAKLNVLERQK